MEARIKAAEAKTEAAKALASDVLENEAGAVLETKLAKQQAILESLGKNPVADRSEHITAALDDATKQVQRLQQEIANCLPFDTQVR